MKGNIMLKQLQFLDRGENRDTFFERVHNFVQPYHDDALLIAKAYKVAKDEFRGKQRKRGERYFEHCRAVALILVDVFGVFDPEVIEAALLHDVIEDCGWTRERLTKEFGERVAALVDGVSMPSGEFTTREERIEAYHQKFMLAANMDARVVLIKLADRLHNLSTCHSLSREAQVRMVEETKEVYLPLAKTSGHHKELEEILRKIAKRLKVK